MGLHKMLFRVKEIVNLILTCGREDTGLGEMAY